MPQKDSLDLLRPIELRRHNTVCPREIKEAIALPRSQSGKSEHLKSCIEDLNRSFGPPQDAASENLNDEVNLDGEEKEGIKKTCVKRFLQTQNLEQDDTSSQKVPKLSLRIEKRNSEILPANLIEGICPSCCSEPPKSGFESEFSEDSKQTDESKLTEASFASLTMQPLKIFESSGGSECVPPNADMSGSTASVKSSPLYGYKGPISTHKKSKFYNGNIFNFEQNTTPEGEKADGEGEGDKEDKDEKKEQILALVPSASSGVIKSAPVKDTDEGQPRKRKMSKSRTIFIPGELKKDGSSPNRPTKITEEMFKLKQEINKKKDMVKAYDVITKQGKAIRNQEPYRWKMERDREDCCLTLGKLLASIPDQELRVFVENFLNWLEKRIANGKLYQETKKILEQAQTKSPDGKIDKINLEKLTNKKRKSLYAQPPKKNFFERSPIESEVPLQATRNLRGLADEDILEVAPSKQLDLLQPSRAQATFGEQNEDFSESLNLDDIENAFDGINDKNRGLSDKSLGKQLGEDKVPKFNKENLTPLSPFSEISGGGYNNYNNPESFRTVGEDEERVKSQSSVNKKDKQKFFDGEERGDNEHQNLDISLTEIKPTIDTQNIKIANLNLMSIDSPFKIEQSSVIKEEATPSLEVRQNIFKVKQDDMHERDDENSPETPSFEIKDAPPLIWRTATAPVRPLRDNKKEVQLGLISKKSNIEELIGRGLNENVNGLQDIGASKGDISQCLQAPAEVDEDEENQSGIRAIKKAVAPRLLRQRNLVQISNARRNNQYQEEQGALKAPNTDRFPEKDYEMEEEKGVVKSTPKINEAKNFAEDRNEIEEKKNECESPISVHSPLVQRGYYSDTEVKNMRSLSKKNEPIGMEDFEPVKLISKGAFGRVWLVRRKATNDLYAMKIVNLAERSAKNIQELENLRRENRILGLAKEDFVVRAIFTFIYETCICFVMEYMIGGDFGDILCNYNALDEDVARFYIAEILLALEYLHSLGIVHRDLKPDNILLDKNGHAKLTDFGLSESGLCQIMKKTLHNEPESPLIYQKKMKAKTLSKLYLHKDELDHKINLKAKETLFDRKNESKGKSNENKDKDNKKKSDEFGSSDTDLNMKKKTSKKHLRLIGTPDYMAPEIITGTSTHNFSIDWWSLGVMLFEFLCGIPPFNDDTPEKIFENITRLRIPWDQIKIGYDEDCMSPEAADLIKSLLVLDPAKRLGANGAWEIKQHRFFEGIDWENLRQQQAKIIPEQKNELDTTNFARMNARISDKERESPFAYLDTDQKCSNTKVAKEFLEASSYKFNMFNYDILESSNLKLVEEALKEKERVLQELKEEDAPNENKIKIIDDIFDTPK